MIHGSRTSKNTNTSNTAPTQSKIDHHRPTVKSVLFEHPYNHINPMDNTHEGTHLIDKQEQNIDNAEVKHE